MQSPSRAARPRQSFLPAGRRRAIPLLATALLTAAIFLLPATGERRQAQASVDDITVSATQVAYE